MAGQWPLLLLLLLAPLWAGAGLPDVCARSGRHKPEPGPEDALSEAPPCPAPPSPALPRPRPQCRPWRDRACCPADASLTAHVDDASLLLAAGLDHCGLLAAGCRRHFLQAACFLACSPNLGPWIRQAAPRGRREGVWRAPLCREDCARWWAACSSSSVCAPAPRGRGARSWGRTRCPRAAPCLPFRHRFPTPAHLCEEIWAHAFRASAQNRSSGRCLQKWFEPPQPNPNRAVARFFSLASPAPAQPLPRALLASSVLLPLLS
ncbi:Sperm-egg fusion protein Juno [Galemys pyrenaicus]|uniref:Sperm-egg fusion protein Juno n=1 Tax=Galemys pyrenaicus TaxID=202257 RepID=A0A8J6ANA2_GALPY|nr:Sperm-egg fusion protein Juno [Galemys pyrenaicus]